MKLIPVLILVFPVPSRFTDTERVVYFVLRLTVAFRGVILFTDNTISFILNLIPLGAN